MKLRSHGRYDFNAIASRPAGTWPNGARLAFYVALNLEQYAFGEGLVEDLVPPLGQPDVMNYSWRDWGNRVGAWRLRAIGAAPRRMAADKTTRASRGPIGVAVDSCRGRGG
jgi:hypothetical protein